MSAAPFAGLHSDLTGEIINAAIEVHTELGCGLKEEAYEAALAWELTQRGHKVLRQVPCPVVYKGNVFCQDDEHPKRIDLIVDDTIVVELKAVCTRHPVFAAQCRTYLRMLNLPAGLVLNFGFPSLRDGIEHVSNPRATPPPPQTSQTPGSESNGREVPEFRSPGNTTFPNPLPLQTSQTPSSESNGEGVPEFRSPGRTNSPNPPPLQPSQTPSSESKENGV